MTTEQTSSPDDGQSFGRINREKLGLWAAPRQDALASVVVFLVALPLCMGIAIASGVPVAAGLITGIVGGIVVGLLAGCPLQVSGPAAGLTVIVYEIVQRFGLEMLGVIVLIGGLIQVVASIFKLGQWFRAVSPAVIKGMLAGIGVLILASQLHVFDLLTGVLVGIGLAAAKLLYTFSHLATKLEFRPDTNKVTLSLQGAATFVRLPRLASELERVPAQAELHVDLQHLDYVDHACLDLLMNWARQHESTNGKLVIDWESLHARFSPEDGGTNSDASDTSADSYGNATAPTVSQRDN